METFTIKWVELRVGNKINIYSNTKALWVPKWYLTIKKFYKVNDRVHVEFKNSTNTSIVWPLEILEIIDFRKV